MDSAPDFGADAVVDGDDASFVIPFAELSLGRCIGAGAFSKVYEGFLRRTIPVAIKALKGSPDLLVFVKKELEVLKYVHRRFAEQFLECYCFVSSCCSRGRGWQALQSPISTWWGVWRL